MRNLFVGHLEDYLKRKKIIWMVEGTRRPDSLHLKGNNSGIDLSHENE